MPNIAHNSIHNICMVDNGIRVHKNYVLYIILQYIVLYIIYTYILYAFSLPMPYLMHI